jgi:hypothetical protein
MLRSTFTWHISADKEQYPHALIRASMLLTSGILPSIVFQMILIFLWMIGPGPLEDHYFCENKWKESRLRIHLQHNTPIWKEIFKQDITLWITFIAP